MLHICTDIPAHLFPLSQDELRLRLHCMYCKVFNIHSVSSLHWILAAASLILYISLITLNEENGQPSFLCHVWRETLFSLERNSTQLRTYFRRFLCLSTDDEGCLKGLRSWHWGLEKTSEVRWDQPWPQALLTYVRGCMRPWHERSSHETLYKLVQTIWKSSYYKYPKSSSSERLSVQPIHLSRI